MNNLDKHISYLFYIHGALIKVSKEAKIRIRYNQVSHLTQDTTGESVKDTIKHHTQDNQEVSPFSAGDYKHFLRRWPQGYNEHTRKYDEHET